MYLFRAELTDKVAPARSKRGRPGDDDSRILGRTDFTRESTALSHRTTSRSHLTTSRSHLRTCMSHSRSSGFSRTTASGCLRGGEVDPRPLLPLSRRLSFVRRPVGVESLKEGCHGRAPDLVRGREGVVRRAGEDQGLPLAVEIVAQMTPSGREMTPRGREMTASRRAMTASRRAMIASRRAMTASRRAMIAPRRAMTASRRAMIAPRRAMTASRRERGPCGCAMTS
jgi:hypothetical protein